MRTTTVWTMGSFCLLIMALPALALTPQGPGVHSSICTSDGHIRDDEFAKMVADAIKASGNTPSSVKVFFNSCYGGGMLDDLEDALGPDNFPDDGIPFIGASASDSDQPSWGPEDDWATATGDGDCWTNPLAEGITNATPGQSVTGTVNTASANDPAAPGGAYVPHLDGPPEEPQTVTAHGGAGVNWSSGAEAIVFGGGADSVRHANDVSKMEDAFLDMWGTDADSNVRSTGTNPNGAGSTADLQQMLTGACNDLDDGEELVIYVDDHGDVDFDIREWWNAFWGKIAQINPFSGWRSEAPDGTAPELHSGWQEGILGNLEHGVPVEASLKLALDLPEPMAVDSFFDIFYDGIELPLPEMMFPGEEVLIELPPDLVFFGEGPHMIEILPDPDAPPLEMEIPILNLELMSGPISQRLLAEITLIPGDLNGDGYVGSADLDIVRTFWNEHVTPGDPLMGDVDGDGYVSSADLDIVRAYWGEGITAVPEPGAWLLLAISALGVVARRR